MKLDEFAFLNQQLAGMLRSGIPLEGALREVCAQLRPGPVQVELRALEGDLARGTPLREALAARRLPPFYTQMVRLGAQSNNLPALLTMLADYYQRAALAWTRLKSLMVYPLIVLVAALGLSVMMALIFGGLVHGTINEIVSSAGARVPSQAVLRFLLWLPAVVIGAALVLVIAGLTLPGLRRRRRWRAPAFKEASLSQLAASLGLLLENGSSLKEALEFTQQLEAGSPAAEELRQWHARLAEGGKNFNEIAAGSRIVPPLFVWLVASAGENLAAGFRSAAQLYFERAVHRVELILYAVLPVSVMALGVLIVLEVVPMTQLVLKLLQSLGAFDGE